MDDLTATIRIKGLRDGLLISLPTGPWDEQSTALLSQIDGQPTFFQGARLALDVGPQIIKVNEMVELRDLLSDRGVSLWAVISESSTTEKTAQLLGLATRVSKPRPEELQSLDARNLPEDTALFVNRTVRSGTRIEYPGTVVVLGDVNPGAEIVVGGSIIVWGRLRGAAHAGSGGEKESVICALDLVPGRLQIAGETLVVPSDKVGGTPEMALVREDRILIDPWQAGSTGQA